MKIDRGHAGLAISGGVDSMALAAVCSRLQHERDSVDVFDVDDKQLDKLHSLLKYIRFRAFLVDHGIRKGSDEEAHAVSKILEGRGIQTQVLTINWNELSSPGELPNFESLARKHRYQLLGKASRRFGINSLLMAHHEDDQAETVMMRLITGQRALGLRGMKPSAGIPECHGIYGVHESGDLVDLVDDRRSIRESPEPRPQSSDSKSKESVLIKSLSSTSRQLPVECGGIRIHRPFLHFNKARLVATCQSEDLRWFDDHTNKDPTVTRRNAIRHVMDTHKLPMALSKPALLQLSKMANEKFNNVEQQAEALLGQCDLRCLETRSGIVRIRFTRLDKVEPAPSHTSEGKKLVAALLIRRIIELVTPEERPSLQSIGGIIESVFPELRAIGESRRPEKAFSVANVQFRLAEESNVTPDGQSRKINWISKGLQEYTWLISRQLYLAKVSEHPLIVIQPRKSGNRPKWTDWRLYDGRFWIRTKNSSSDTFRVRPFYKDDMSLFRRSRSQVEQEILDRELRNFAPGDVRWTLPAIARVGADRKETVLVLPTLRTATAEGYGYGLAWQVRYKKIDTGGLCLHNLEKVRVGRKI